MKGNKSSISKAETYKDIGNFWDNHDLSDYWDKGKNAEFEVNIKSEITYFGFNKEISEQIQSIACEQGISADILINQWVKEKLQEQKA